MFHKTIIKIVQFRKLGGIIFTKLLSDGSKQFAKVAIKAKYSIKQQRESKAADQVDEQIFPIKQFHPF